MSWDIYLRPALENVCAHCGRGDSQGYDYYDRNYTSNMWPMLRKAKFDWDAIQDKPVVEALPEISRLITELQSDPNGYRELNPPNGWGEYSSFLAMLCELEQACKEHPDAIFHISR